MSATSTNFFHKLGAAVGAAAHGLRFRDIPALEGFSEHLDKHEDGRFHKMAAQAGAMCYALAGREDSFGHHLYVKIASSPWLPGYVDLMQPLYQALGKSANAGWLSPLKTGWDGLQTAALVSALAGLGTGALNWKLNRDITTDEDDTAVLQARRDEYRRVADEINANLALNGIGPAR